MLLAGTKFIYLSIFLHVFCAMIAINFMDILPNQRLSQSLTYQQEIKVNILDYKDIFHKNNHQIIDVKNKKITRKQINIKNISKKTTSLNKNKNKNKKQIKIANESPPKHILKQANKSSSSLNESILTKKTKSSTQSKQFLLTKKQIYMAYVRKEINNRKTYPRLARKLRQSGRVVIQVRLDREGNMIAHNFLKKSKYSLLNKNAEKTILIQKKFKPLPAEFTTATVAINIPLSYQ